MRDIDEIIIHCTATPEGRDYTVDDIDRIHRQRGFSSIGYHYVVYRDGSVHPGRPVERPGAHCLGHNTRSVGVCYIGGVASDGKTPKDTRTPQQRQALRDIVAELCSRFPGATVHGHYEYNPQNETEDGNKSKWSKIKTKRDSPQNEAYLRVRFFNRPPYPIFAPKSTRLRRGQG